LSDYVRIAGRGREESAANGPHEHLSNPLMRSSERYMDPKKAT
jgi:hypothetical protein